MKKELAEVSTLARCQFFYATSHLTDKIGSTLIAIVGVECDTFLKFCVFFKNDVQPGLFRMCSGKETFKRPDSATWISCGAVRPWIAARRRRVLLHKPCRIFTKEANPTAKSFERVALCKHHPGVFFF